MNEMKNEEKTAAATVTNERDAFEAWAQRYDLVAEPNYSEATKADCWAAWKARAALAATPAAEPGKLGDDMQMRCRKCGEQVTIEFNSARIVTHNPHTGKPRDERDIASDPEGKLIVAPGPLFAAAAPVVLPEPDAWLAVYEDRDGNSKFYTSTHKDLAVENDTNGKPQPLYTEQKVSALLATATGLPAQADTPDSFREWFAKNYPADTIIVDPDWHAKSIFRMAQAHARLAAPQAQPVRVDAQTMDIAESAGLIGPNSRVHDLHAAIQRFHDLIIVKASIKAAQDFSNELVKLAAAQRKCQVFVLTVNQMCQAIEFATGGVAPDTQSELETSLSFSIGKVQDEDGKIVADGVYCWLTKLAEEGVFPLDEFPTEGDITALSAPQAQASGVVNE